jgi:RimJ/RimL family protein N-acetyltransferase
MITDNTPQTYRSKRLLYRAPQVSSDADKAFVFTILADQQLTLLTGPSLPHPPSEQKRDVVLGQLAASDLGVLICLPADSEADLSVLATLDGSVPIGWITLGWGGTSPSTRHNRHSTIGITLLPQHQGKGYGGEAINWAVDWGFSSLALHRISIGTVSFNDRAQHLYKKLGFKEEGRVRECFWHNRRWYDLVEYGMLEGEWEALRAGNAQ